MSLINDALKRASGKPAANNPDLPPAVPVKPEDERKSSPRAWVLAGLAILVIGAAVFLLRKTPDPAAAKTEPAPARAQSQPAAAPAAQPVARNPVARAAATFQQVADGNQEGGQIAETMAKPAATATPAPAVAPKPVALAAPTPARPAPAAQPSAAPPAKIGFPELKLQAIYYRMNSPTAVVNGKTVRPGQEIAGAKIVAIHRESVEVEFQGKKRTIPMN